MQECTQENQQGLKQKRFEENSFELGWKYTKVPKNLSRWYEKTSKELVKRVCKNSRKEIVKKVSKKRRRIQETKNSRKQIGTTRVYMQKCCNYLGKSVCNKKIVNQQAWNVTKFYGTKEESVQQSQQEVGQNVCKERPHKKQQGNRPDSGIEMHSKATQRTVHNKCCKEKGNKACKYSINQPSQKAYENVVGDLP